MALTKILLLIFFLSPTFIHALSKHEQETLTLALDETLIQQACINTTNSAACASRIRTDCNNRGQHGPLPVLHAAIRLSIDEVRRAADNISDLAAISDDLREQTAIVDCTELLDHTLEELSWSLSEMAHIESNGSVRHQSNLRSWLSAAVGNQDTCVEGFQGTDGRLKQYVSPSMSQVSQLVTNLLVLSERTRGMMPPEVEGDHWVGMDEEVEDERVDVVVAKDGTGRYRTVNEAVNAAPSHGKRRYVILVKRGVYKENVEVKRKKSNIMIVGEGMGVTVITGSRSFVKGWTTFRSATFGE